MKINKALALLSLSPILVSGSTPANASGCVTSDPLCRMQSVMDSFLNDFTGNDIYHSNIRALNNFSSYPDIDVINNEKEMLVKADIPGVDKNNIEVNLFENYIEISGKREVDNKKNENNYSISERGYGEFRRVLSLPAKADINKAKSNYENGVLEISIPKIEPEKPKSVKLKI